MSSRSSIWLGEDEGKSLHVYWDLAEREIEGGKLVAAPICIAVQDSKNEVAIRLPKNLAEALLSVLCPNYNERFRHKVC